MKSIHSWAGQVLGLVLVAPLLSHPAPLSHAKYPGQTVIPEQPGPGARGAVACESKICSQIGIDILTRGGNAVDAWVATQLCVGVVAMYHSGIGGGGFALIRTGNGSYTSLDYREAAPAAAHRDMYEGNVRGSIFGGLAVAVPGELRGLERAHSSFGILPWPDVVRPAARLARRGFPVTLDAVRYMEEAVRYAGLNFLVDDANWSTDFAPNGTLLRLGETMTRRRYADTLEAIAVGGADVFYRGRLAEAIVSSIRKSNGTMTTADLARYRAVTRPSRQVKYRAYKIHSLGAPCSGVLALSLLKTMETYGPAESADANLTTHRLDEAMRFAYGARQHLGDPDHVDGVEELQAELLTAAAAQKRRSSIDDDRTQPVAHYLSAGSFYAPDSHGTSHIVTADRTGMAVSSTSTVNLLYGSLVLEPGSGVLLNNEMNDFSIPGRSNEFGYAPSPSNYVAAGKRPLSSAAPLMIEHAAPSPSPSPSSRHHLLHAVVGAAGGSRILSSTAQVAWRLLEHGASIRRALAEPRIHDQLMPNEATLETGFDRRVAASLAKKGHQLRWIPSAASAVQGIRVGDAGVFEAAGEPRQESSGGLNV